MRKLTLSLTAIAILSIVSCKKDDKGDSVKSSDAPSTLMGKKWQLTAYIYKNGGVEVDGYGNLPACQADNTLEFKSDKSNEIDEGASKCNASDPQTRTEGKWELRSDNTEIYVSGMTAVYGIDALSLTIISLSSSTLKLKYTTSLGGLTAENTATYTAR